MVRSGEALLVIDAEALHDVGELRQGLRDAVLYLHLRLVDIGTQGERDREGHHAIGGGLRGLVEHPLDAVDRLLERTCHGLRDDFGVRARVGCLHDHRRRHHFRVLADRKLGQCDQAGQENECRENARKDRAADEELREFHDES